MAVPTRTIPAHEKYGLPVAFTADSRSLVTGGWDGSLSRWRIRDCSELAATDGHEQSVNGGVLSAGGLLATGSTDTTVRIWKPDTLQEVAQFTGHAKTVTSLTAHPERSTVASASYDSTVRLWDLEAETVAGVFEEHSSNVTSVVFAGAGEYIASGGLGDQVLVWAVHEPDMVARLPGHGTAVVGIDTNAPNQLWTCAYDGTIRRWTTEAWEETIAFTLSDGASPNGIATHPTEDVHCVTKDHGVVILDAEGTVLVEHELDIEGVFQPRWSPDGTWLAVGGADGRIRLYEWL